MKRLLNFGSLNIDFSYGVKEIAAPGETVKALSRQVHIGGKGLNQSVAFARAGGRAFHGGKIGPDGLFLKQFLAEEGVETGAVLETGTVTGHAMIQVEESGQNAIVVFGGANRELTEAEINAMLEPFAEGDVLLLQNEVSGIGYAASRAKAKGMTVVLNPSPAADLKLEFAHVDWFILNESEGALLFGGDARPEVLADRMREACPHAKFVLTLGEKGSLYIDSRQILKQEAFPVQVLDTTGAGDTFTGYFLQSMLDHLQDGSAEDVQEALQRASKAAALAVTRPGAAEAIPFAAEADEFVKF